MEIHHQHQKNREKQIEEEGAEYLRQVEAKEGKATTKQASPTTSPSSSPSHEFSFMTISLHSSTTIPADKSKPSSLAIDLSPADDIFFHGHLLPLHLLSHLPSSPRFSTNSINSFFRDSLEDHENPLKESGSCGTSNRSDITMDRLISSSNNNNNSNSNSNSNSSIEDNINRRTKGGESKTTKTNNTFSMFGLTRGRKGICQASGDHDKEEEKEKHKKRKVIGYDVMHALKRYLRSMVLFRGRREKDGLHHHGHAYNSRSGNLIRKNKPELMMRGRRGEYSAPASMRTSPTNSGLLLPTKTLPPANDSTMEELQAAIQAAIAHCKNSIAKEDKLLKC